MRPFLRASGPSSFSACFKLSKGTASSRTLPERGWTAPTATYRKAFGVKSSTPGTAGGRAHELRSPRPRRNPRPEAQRARTGDCHAEDRLHAVIPRSDRQGEGRVEGRGLVGRIAVR